MRQLLPHVLLAVGDVLDMIDRALALIARTLHRIITPGRSSPRHPDRVKPMLISPTRSDWLKFGALGKYGLPAAQTGAVPSGLVGIFWHQPILPPDPGAGRVVAAPSAHVLLETVAPGAHLDSAFAGLGRRFANCHPAWRQ